MALPNAIVRELLETVLEWLETPQKPDDTIKFDMTEFHVTTAFTDTKGVTDEDLKNHPATNDCGTSCCIAGAMMELNRGNPILEKIIQRLKDLGHLDEDVSDFHIDMNKVVTVKTLRYAAVDSIRKLVDELGMDRRDALRLFYARSVDGVDYEVSEDELPSPDVGYRLVDMNKITPAMAADTIRRYLDHGIVLWEGGNIAETSLNVTYDRDYSTYVVRCPELPGCHTRSYSLDGAIELIDEKIMDWRIKQAAGTPPETTAIKQLIIVRSDLKMGRGKESAQVAHASMLPLLNAPANPHVRSWIHDGSFTKVVLKVDSEEELDNVFRIAQDHNILAGTITDKGLTEFNGVPTKTTAHIGPHPAKELDELFGHLKLR